MLLLSSALRCVRCGAALACSATPAAELEAREMVRSDESATDHAPNTSARQPPAERRRASLVRERCEAHPAVS